jgi:hypothetical protein
MASRIGGKGVVMPEPSTVFKAVITKKRREEILYKLTDVFVLRNT